MGSGSVAIVGGTSFQQIEAGGTHVAALVYLSFQQIGGRHSCIYTEVGQNFIIVRILLLLQEMLVSCKMQ